MTEAPTIEGRDVAIREGFADWRAESAPILTFEGQDFDVCIYGGAHDRGEEQFGFTLWWTDNVINEWAEHYTDLATTVARLAALIRGVERDQFFSEGPIGFTRWSENFFRQALNDPPPKPTTGGEA